MVADLGWVDLDLDVPSSCPAAQPLFAHFPSAQAESGRHWNIKIQVNPIQVHGHQPHPVLVKEYRVRGRTGWYDVSFAFVCLLLSHMHSSHSEFLALKHESRILGHSSSPVCGFSMMEQVRLCAVWPMYNWLGSSLNQIQGWTTIRESYSRALEQGPLIALVLYLAPLATLSP